MVGVLGLMRFRAYRVSGLFMVFRVYRFEGLRCFGFRVSRANRVVRV